MEQDQVSGRPRRNVDDAAQALVRGAVGAIPLVGAGVGELFNWMVTPSLEKRRDDWIESLERRIRNLETRGVDLQALREDEVFLTTVMEASRAALITHEDEKLEALRNAVVNAAMPGAPDATMQSLFLNAVRDLAPWHLRILKWFQDPRGWCVRHGIDLPTRDSSMSLGVFLEMSMPELKDRSEFYRLILTEFFRREFMTTQSVDIGMSPTPSELYAKRLTALGNEFIRFIEVPPE